MTSLVSSMNENKFISAVNLLRYDLSDLTDEQLLDQELMHNVLKNHMYNPLGNKPADDMRMIGAIQNPKELADYLVVLNQLRPQSYLELGMYECGTLSITVEYLKRIGCLQKVVGVDISVKQQVNDYRTMMSDSTITIDIIQGSTTDDSIKLALTNCGPFDFVFVDADHNYEPVKNDVTLALSVGKHIAMHDITSRRDVPRVWSEITEDPRINDDYIIHKFCCGIGIGLLEKR